MEMIIIVTIVAAMLSIWGLGYVFISARNNIGRHQAWHIKKKQEMDRKLQKLKDMQNLYETEIRKFDHS
ncbi:hypothetical protein [Desulfoplanes formicivorans]|uniref:Uncharacterized protein n=1 Tax=Desulfoplanes formicivorans TaxID=1592317 RepID=A0A194ACK2_9BACT|nr:hypothetical protein [Desulfoplanes formicivorans]GAU07862.1 hypothetical protein DPF_0561 [Desulfoplanes formicivorans]